MNLASVGYYCMSFSESNLSTISIAYFTGCIALTVHLLLFSNPSTDIRKAILTYLLIFCGLKSSTEIFIHRDEPNLRILPGGAIGATLGFIGGFYAGYWMCIVFRLFDGVGPIESSTTSLAISFTIAEFSRQAGSFLGNVLFLTYF